MIETPEQLAAALRIAARFWHGGWDGDLLRGFMKGSLRVPFRPR